MLQNGRVEFFAPVVSGIEYNLASPVEDYVSDFENRLKKYRRKTCCSRAIASSTICIPSWKAAARAPLSDLSPLAKSLSSCSTRPWSISRLSRSPSPPGVSNATTLELSAAHEELQASERRFRTLSEFAPMGIFLTGEDGRLVYENSRCQELSGVSTEDAIAGRSWLQSIHPNDLPGVTAGLKESETQRP